eukprot:GHVR01128450.1.p1 GENE.GHVR01128450.1~~GHVR01128450.1.p1  ORF type:complete len:135 (+),score=11.13 GHVR01128450.1:420-824(+)
MDDFMNNDVSEFSPNDSHDSTKLKEEVIDLIKWWDARVTAMNPSIPQGCEWLTHALQNQPQGAQHVVPYEFIHNERGLPPPACCDYQPITMALNESLKHLFRCRCTNFFQRHTKCSINRCLKLIKGKLLCKSKH